MGNLFRDEVPQRAMGAGRGVQSLLGQCPNRWDISFGGPKMFLFETFIKISSIFVESNDQSEIVSLCRASSILTNYFDGPLAHCGKI